MKLRTKKAEMDDLAWDISIETSGQCGFIYYVEGPNSVKFDWEYGAHDIIAFIWGQEPEIWDRENKWAIGRRKEIMHRIAAAVIKNKAPGCKAEFKYDNTTILIKE